MAGIMDFLFKRATPTMLDEDDPRIRAQREAQQTTTIPSLGDVLFTGEYTGERTVPYSVDLTQSGLINDIIKGNPALDAVIGGVKSGADPLLDVLQGSSYFPDLDIDVIPPKPTQRHEKQGSLQRKRSVGGAGRVFPKLSPEYARSQQFGIGKGGAPVRRPNVSPVGPNYRKEGRGGAPGMAKSERDPWLTDDDAAFLLSLLDPILNPPKPHTPYGTFGGGGNKAWASLPFLMRGYS